jgi:hypothetical protein
MAELTNAEIDTALENGRIARATQPRAAKARYDRELGRIVVDLTNGCVFAFPPRLTQGLERATDDQLAGDGNPRRRLRPALGITRRGSFDSGTACRHRWDQVLYGAARGPDKITGEGGSIQGQWRKGRTTAKIGSRVRCNTSGTDL